MAAQPSDSVSVRLPASASPAALGLQHRIVHAIALTASVAATAAGLAVALAGPLYWLDLAGLDRATALLRYGAEVGGGAAIVVLVSGLWTALVTGDRRLLALISAAALIGGLASHIAVSYGYPGTPIPPVQAPGTP